MTLEEYADTIRCAIHLMRYPQQDGRWVCALADIERKDGNESPHHVGTKKDEYDIMLTGTYGNGKTMHEAMNDYIEKIRGRIVVITRWDQGYKQETFGVPGSLRIE